MVVAGLEALVFVATMIARSTFATQQLTFHSFGPGSFGGNAVCNDGSIGGYYYADASRTEQASTFIINFPGGGQCYDEQTCTTRSKGLSTSHDAPFTIGVDGLLDSDPTASPLWGANKAHLLYCSSDAYMGDVGASEATWYMHFRGQALVQSLIEALFRDHGLRKATKIYLSGESAGARGMMTWIDELVSSYLPPQAEVIGFLDSPYYLDVVPYTSSFPGFLYEEQQKYLLFNTVGILSDECGSAYPHEPWKCQLGQYRMPFVKTSFFMVASQFDAYQLRYLTGMGTAASFLESLKEEEEYLQLYQYVNNFAAYDLQSTAQLASGVTEHRPGSHPTGYGIMNTGCLNHAISSTSMFNQTISSTEDFVSIRSAFEQFLGELSRPPPVTNSTWVVTWTDGCHSIGCAIQCRVVNSDH